MFIHYDLTFFQYLLVIIVDNNNKFIPKIFSTFKISYMANVDGVKISTSNN